MMQYERRLWSDGYAHIAGLDEAGRGCLAGPVVAAAVILPEGCVLEHVQDSKTLSDAKRRTARAEIEAKACAVAVGQCSPEEIDELNILRAALTAMHRAAEACDPAPDLLLVDGNQRIVGAPWPQHTIVKGDAKSQSIAAASIIAKTTRDDLMHALHETHPHYGWNTNVGYPTKQHYEGLAARGATSHHRQSFRLFKNT
ncbi:ribonuclease HII [Salisaeta longa]|uniref:ribonuclease HII n=1 Tax=Salisaeta longa TaxID=503170 RepID=UPI0003B5E46B|nr:ribonuclease HII [Salisaeta longa]